jgi:hypothetical protein
MAGKRKAIPAEYFLVEKIVDFFREIHAKIPIFPLANNSWILIVKPNPYISMKARGTPCSAAGRPRRQVQAQAFKTFPQFPMNVR